jgi:MFS family permease
MLIAMRVIQALGAGMLFSAGPAIITNAVPPENRGKALSAVAVSVALGLTSGPLIGGLLATHTGWPSIFYINVPIGAAGIAMVMRFVPDTGRKSEKIPFDVLGSILVFAALLLILLPLSISGNEKMPGALFGALLGVGILLVAVFIIYELKHRHPMLDVRLFKNRVFAASSVAALFIYLAQYVLVFLSPFYLQTLQQFTPDYAGLLYLPMPLASMLVAPVSGILSDRIVSRFLSAAGALIMAGGLFMLGLMNASTPVAYILVSMAATGSTRNSGSSYGCSSCSRRSRSFRRAAVVLMITCRS